MTRKRKVKSPSSGEDEVAVADASAAIPTLAPAPDAGVLDSPVLDRAAPEATAPDSSVAAMAPAPTAPTVERLFTIIELSALTQIQVASIHHYRRKGLLPPPVPSGTKKLLFNRDHVEALKLIGLLRSQWRLSLDAIGELLPQLLAVERQEPFSVDTWNTILRAHLVRADPSQPMARLLVAARDRFAKDGYAEASVSQICEDAGIAKGSFYLYFPSKHDLFLAAALSTVEAVGNGLGTLDQPITERTAEREVAALLKPFVPLYLEVVIRELRGETDVTGLTLGITEGIAGQVSPHLLGKGQAALKAGRRVANAAWLRVLRPALGLR
jgi:AcrR family transcriptional regulator